MRQLSRFGNSRGAFVAGAAVLVALGAAGGAGAVRATRPSIEMAPTVQTPIARLPATSGVVTVKGRVAEVYGDRFVMQDASGRTMIAAARDGQGTIRVGQTILVQGRYDDGQVRASYLVDQSGAIQAVGPRPGGPEGPGGHHPHGPDRDGPPPPPPGCAPVSGDVGAGGTAPQPPRPATVSGTAAAPAMAPPTQPSTPPRS